MNAGAQRGEAGAGRAGGAGSRPGETLAWGAGPLVSRFVALPADSVDTDQIIPARFLKVTDKTGLGDRLFADWRYGPDGRPKPDFVLNRPAAKAARILIAGHDFGCGSSREHAAWALTSFGFRAVISTSFADIFRANAVKNGLLPVTIGPEHHERLLRVAENAPEAVLTIDLEEQVVALPGEFRAAFPIDPFSKHCLLNGVDELDHLLAQEALIARYEAERRATAPGGP